MFDNVSAKNFYSCEKEKTKMNWFLYEYANALYLGLVADSKLKKITSDKEKLAQFCVFFTKKMKESILDKLIGKTDATEMNDEYVTDYYKHLTNSMVNKILDVAEDEWDNLLSGCMYCVQACITNKDDYSNEFDKWEL